MRWEHVAVAVLAFLAAVGGAPAASQSFVLEREDNDTAAQGTALGGTNVVARGNIYPNADLDYWTFDAVAGDRVYAAVMTSGSSSTNFDSVLELISTNGTTVLESDNDDGSLGATSSSIAGKLVTASGRYHLKVSSLGFVPNLMPYQLHVRVQSSTGAPESEPNDDSTTANPLPAGGHVSGTHTSGDADWFSLPLGAGDSVYLSVDADPERNLATWSPRLAFGRFGDGADQLVAVDDPGATSPNSEALFFTVRDAGTYFVRVDSVASPGGAAETYRLSASVHPATPASAVCTTYTSADVPRAIPDGSGPSGSTLVVPGNPRILDLDVSIELSHPVMADLDAHLVAPGGNDVGLFTDVGSVGTGGQTKMDLTLDDEAALPINVFPVMQRHVVQTEAKYRLSWFDGQDAGGAWTLQLWDDNPDGNAGTLTGWKLTICEAPPPPACSGTTVTVYSSDFESGDAGFTHSGTLDEWGRGLPSGLSAPILGCNSGTSCWKTNLTNVYPDNALMLLRSPALSLSGLTAPIRASWAQTYHMENATFDAMEVDVEDLISSSVETLFLWTDGSMSDDVGVSNAETIEERAGWAISTGNLDAYAGRSVRLVYGLASDGFVGYSGLAVDDVTVTACCTAASCDDGNACTTDVCDATLGCLRHPTVCNDSNPCTSDACNPAGGACVFTPVTGGSCDDGDPCTIGDACAGGACAGSPVPAPVEVNASVMLAKSGASATIAWSDSPGPYHVYRGIETAAPWSYRHTCFAGPLAAPPTTDGTVPATGGFYYYLVTRRDACGESIPGRASGNVPIPNANPCP